MTTLTKAKNILIGKLNNRYTTANVLTIIAATLGLAYMLTHPHMWPLYLLIILWLLVLTKYRTKQNITTLTIFTALIIAYTWLGSTIIAAITAPAGQKITTLNNWFNAPHVTIWAMLAGSTNLTEFAATTRAMWQANLLWYTPVAALITWLSVRKLASPDERATLHGSAHFAEPRTVKLTGHKAGFLLGKEKSYVNGEVVLPLKEVHEHILMDGAPGAGKSASIFIPNLLRIAENGSYCNIVATDPKMELLSVCGPVLKEAGYKVLVFHPYAPEISSAWNMLSYASDYESVDDIVLTIIANTNIDGKGDVYWDQQSNQLLDLICFYLRELLGDNATMNHVQAMAGTAKPADIEVTLKNSPNDKIRLNATGFFSKIGGNDKVISSIMSDLPRRLKLWTMDPIRATTSRNEINFAELCTDQKVALFVVTPMDKKDQLKPLFATFFSQLFKVVQEKGRELGKLPRPLWFMLDEFANLGTIPGFDNFLTVVRGYKVGVTMGIQSLSQLEELYGKNRAQTIADACATYVIFPRIGKKDADYFSQMLGKTTKLTINRSFTKNALFTELKHRATESAIPRPLMGPDEIRALEHGENLIVIAGTRHPILIRPALYYKDRRWLELGKECNDEKQLQARRLIFLRDMCGMPPLIAPSEQAMMEEAALITSASIPKKKKKDSKPEPQPKSKEPPATGTVGAGSNQVPVQADVQGKSEPIKQEPKTSQPELTKTNSSDILPETAGQQSVQKAKPVGPIRRKRTIYPSPITPPLSDEDNGQSSETNQSDQKKATPNKPNQPESKTVGQDKTSKKPTKILKIDKGDLFGINAKEK
jgi:type IV secretory pathway TraG/TraD family ATPase VirD4